jgi:hypothetical protein
VRLYSNSMDRQYSIYRYSTRLVHDNKEGNSALELHMTRKDGTVDRVARVVFWDACGDFFFETFGHQVPVRIAEELMIEAKETIKVR